MPRRKPTLGYGSRTEAAVALKADGLTEQAIAERIGVSRNAVSGLLASARDLREAPQIGRIPSRGADDTLAAKRAGIMLSHEAGRPAHRPTSDGAMRVIEIRLVEAQFGKLVEMARKANRTPSSYAGDLFQAAYAARTQPTGDRALDAEVARMGAPEAPGAAKLAELTTELERCRAELARADATIAGMADEIEALSTRPAVSLDAATAIALDEAQAQVAALGEQLETALAGQEDAERRARRYADQLDETNGHVLALQEALQSLGEEAGVEPGSERIAGLREVFTQQADTIRDLMERVAELKTARDGHSAPSPKPAEGVAQCLTALQVRQARSLRAAGNSIGEIVAELGTTAALVRQALESR